jgi:HSP20 family protein
MTPIRKRRIDRPARFHVEVPAAFRRMVDLDWEGWLRVEELVDDGTLVVRAALPGIDPDRDVDLSVADGVLHIRAQREESTGDGDGDVDRSEVRYRSFVRSVSLPPGVDEDATTATYEDGILEVRVPLPADEGRRPVTRVPVAHG